MLVGTKLDLRKDPKTDHQTKHVTAEEVGRVAKEIGAVASLECSALANVGLDEAFHAACRAALDYIDRLERKKKRVCAVM